MNYFYLLINLVLLLLSFALALDRKASSSRNWKLMIRAVLASGLFFLVVAFVLNQLKVSVLTAGYTVGFNILQLPVEEVLFPFVLSFAGLNMYVVLNTHYPKNDLEKFSLSFSNLLLGVLIAMLFFTYTKIYSIVAFSVLLLLLLYVEYVNKLRFMYRFYRTYVVLLILFCLLFILTGGLPVPFEWFFYLMSILLLSIYLFEVIKRKNKA